MRICSCAPALQIATPALQIATSNHQAHSDAGSAQTNSASDQALSGAGALIPMQHSAPAAHDMTTHHSVGSSLPADANTQEKQRIFLDQILAGTTRLRDVRAAKAEGWTRITGGDGATVHVINDRLMQDGKTLDPANPEVLIYRVDGSKWSLIGAMFQGGRDGAVDNKDGLALKTHGHDGSAADSGHVWFMPGDLEKAYGDRGDPPDELMGDMNWNNAAGNAFRMNQANTEATKRAFAAL